MFYVYTLSDPLTGEVFYVGKGGKVNRAPYHIRMAKAAHPRDNNLIKAGVIRAILALGLEPIFARVFETACEHAAHEHERFLIASMGRRINKSGPLTNITEGGEGSSGRAMTTGAKDKIRAAATGRKHSAETRSKISEAQLGKKRGPYKRSGFKGKTHSPEAIERIRAAAKAREENRKKVSYNDKVNI